MAQTGWLLVEQMPRSSALGELDFLQAQINPHFIYNTLSSMRFLCDMGKAEQASEMLFFFQKLLRKTLSNSKELVTLEEELGTIRDYVSLQEIRYPGQFEVSYTLAPEALFQMIPTMLVQPVVENAIFYSMGMNHGGRVEIAAWVEENRLRLTVSDNGVGMSQEQIQASFHKNMQVNKVGVKNVHERIQLIYGLDYGLTITSQPGRGTMIHFSLPAGKMGED